MWNPYCKAIWTVSLILYMIIYLSLRGVYYYKAYAFGYLFFGTISRFIYDITCDYDIYYDSQYLFSTFSIYSLYKNLNILITKDKFKAFLTI